MAINNYFRAGLTDFFKQGKRYGYKAYPPPWMDEKQRKDYFNGKRYAIGLNTK